MSIERLRALEKAVELVAKATPGPWQQVGSTHSYGIGGDFTPGAFSLVAGGTSGKDCDAVVAAVNFIREHGSALIAELGQEVGAVAYFAADPANGEFDRYETIEEAKERAEQFLDFAEDDAADSGWADDPPQICYGVIVGHCVEESRKPAPSGSDFTEIVTFRLESSPAHTSEARDADEDGYVIEQMGRLLAEIAVIVNGPEPAMTKWSYHDLPEKVRKLQQGAGEGREG